MFRKAVFKLTILYSVLFFILFSSFSLGLYSYVKNSFNQGYATKVRERVSHERDLFGRRGITTTLSIEHRNVFLSHATRLTLENLRKGLFILNGILLFFIPAVSWVLVRKTLSPVDEVFRKQKQFVSDASHELQTPLTIAANEIEVALSQERSLSYYAQTLTGVKEEVYRLSRLVKNLLMLAQQEKSIGQVAMDEVEIVDILSKVVALLQKKIDQKHIKLSIAFPEENITVRGNASMLEQLFSNLIDNAIKFSSPAGAIEIAVHHKKNSVEVAIRDYGCGIAQEEKTKIFDRFYRVDASRTETKGYGLGLAIVKTILSLHNGRIAVDSAPSRGSVFTIVLPLH